MHSSFLAGCPRGEVLVNCLVDPCRFASLSNFLKVECQGDYCGGCNARFFLGTKEVTKNSGMLMLHCLLTPPPLPPPPLLKLH